MVKLADWGKTKELKQGEAAWYSGNRTFRSADKDLSFESETYSAALILIRVLEAPFISEGSASMLLDPPPGGHLPKELEQNLGVARYLSLHPNCPQGTRNGIKSPLSRFRTSYAKAAQPALDCYIEELCKRYGLEGRGGDLRDLLKSMTHPDPSQRISMEQARDRYAQIFGISI